MRYGIWLLACIAWVAWCIGMLEMLTRWDARRRELARKDAFIRDAQEGWIRE